MKKRCLALVVPQGAVVALPPDDDEALGSETADDGAPSVEEQSFSPPPTPTTSAARGWMDWKKVAVVDSVLRALPPEPKVEAWFDRLLSTGFLKPADLEAFCASSVAGALLDR